MAERVKRQRMCVTCRTKSEKLEFFRFVRTQDGVVFDRSGRVAGRGAYVCSKQCLLKALQSGQLGRALKTRIDDNDGLRILEEFEDAQCVS